MACFSAATNCETMMNPLQQIVIRDGDVFALTGTGDNELRGAATNLSRQALELLVLVDGKASVAQLTQRAPALSREVFIDTLRRLLNDRLIGHAAPVPSDDLDFTAFLSPDPGPQPSEGALSAASQEAQTGEAALRRAGYYVRIARASAAGGRKLKQGERLSAVVIEDDPHLGKLLRQFLALDGFDAVIAANRAEIVAAFRRPQRPDLVLLDVVLPDADGFDVLAKIRKHPALRYVPVIMLTAKTTRESVLRGLAGGADGYITKPFEVDVLAKAVGTVLGIAA